MADLSNSVSDRVEAETSSGAAFFSKVRDGVEALRPILRRDGGDLRLIAVEGDLVIVDLTGTCAGCSLAVVTVAGIRKTLSDTVGRPLRVVPLAALPAAMRQRFAA